MSPSPDWLLPEAAAHYSQGLEMQRLTQGTGQLEFARTQELLQRYLPKPKSVIMDIGGGSGVYALWLAQLGYEVHLIDAIPLHIEQARTASLAQPQFPLASAEVGDARKLTQDDSSADAVLIFGPLYHLIEQSDRETAWREAHRILRPGGLVFGVGISRFASMLDGFVQGHMDDPLFVKIVDQDLKDGQHRNPTNHPYYFTTVYLHHPVELKSEMEAAGFQHERTVGIEGPGWLLQNFDQHWNDPARRTRLLDAMRKVEEEPTLLGASAHIMAIGQKAF